MTDLNKMDQFADSRSHDLPIGIQSFEKLRTDNYVYVDKTEYIYKLVHSSTPYFLSRPRRFGKSLFLSTLKAYWEGKKELFSDLAIEKLEKDNDAAWQSYPIFYFDFNRESYWETGKLEEVLNSMLKGWEKFYDCDVLENTFALRFQNLLEKAYEQTGKRCVILIDEYDKPLLDTIGNQELLNHNRELFKGFFSCLKSFDEYLQFVFITGVTKFNKVSIFSDLNQLNDITFDCAYAGICGITETELKNCFSDNVKEFALIKKMSYDECLHKLKNRYDGYRFSSDELCVYNLHSLLNSFSKKKFGSYWFETGTPTFLMKMIVNAEINLQQFDERSIYITESDATMYRIESNNPIPLLYQTGYLTIIDYDSDSDFYTLGIPNEEVRYGFFNNLMNEYIPSLV